MRLQPDVSLFCQSIYFPSTPPALLPCRPPCTWRQQAATRPVSLPYCQQVRDRRTPSLAGTLSTKQ